MDERIFIDDKNIIEERKYGKMPYRSSFPKEVFEAESKFGIKVVGIMFNKKESGSPNFTVDLIIDEGESK